MPARFCAVDVGTGSARAGIFDASGRLLARSEHPILINQSAVDRCEHDSEDVWASVCSAVRAAVTRSGAPPQEIAGIGFDATCSLVARSVNGAQIGVSTDRQDRWDTIVWLDHRAHPEAERCTATGHRVLDFVGGTMSPEMQVPKLMWLKQHRPDSWARIGYLFDLTDFLTWKASGQAARSTCTLAAKWTYLSHETQGWQGDFLARVGLPDLLEKGRLPNKGAVPGTNLGGLTAQAAQQLGLRTSCKVAAGFIDAYAGALGVLGQYAQQPTQMSRRMALIAGTSSCVMTISPDPRWLASFWGPHRDVILPGLWVTEGGQSATGALLDYIVGVHSAGGEPDAVLHARIIARIGELRSGGEHAAARLHVLPDFHGNRSPYGDPQALGVISGLTLDPSFDGLCLLYWRTCAAIAFGVRHILETLNANGRAIDTLHVTGGHTRNPLLMELYADAARCTVVEPVIDEAVLLGTAMTAATAAGAYPDLATAAVAMQQEGEVRRPDEKAARRHDRDYQIFLEMHRHRQAVDRMSAGN